METDERNRNKGALWVKVSSKDGSKFMSGNIILPDGTKYDIAVFKNRYKEEGDRRPEYDVKLTPPADLVCHHTAKPEARVPARPNDPPFDKPKVDDDLPF